MQDDKMNVLQNNTAWEVRDLKKRVGSSVRD
jgi:hypothetical protein